MEAPLNLDKVDHDAWHFSLKRQGDDTFDPEPFDEWWGRVSSALSHLPKDLCEQWIYRHWFNSSFSFLPLDKLTCVREQWDGDKVLASVYRTTDDELNPQFDYDTFHRGGGEDRHQTAVALDSGTWDFPIVLLATPSGVINNGQSRPNVRYVLVEGHQRHRYLNALHALGRAPAGTHEVLILSVAADATAGCL